MFSISSVFLKTTHFESFIVNGSVQLGGFLELTQNKDSYKGWTKKLEKLWTIEEKSCIHSEQFKHPGLIGVVLVAHDGPTLF